MGNYSSFNLVYKLQKWMDSVSGQTFLNYAYSWGASIVILGTLFKLTHLPLANVMLFLGMGTEVFVFFISAFDRPFDKTADGQELTTSKDKKAAKEETPEVIEQTPEIAAVASPITVQGVQPTPEQIAAMEKPDWLIAQEQVSPEMAEAQSKYVESLNKLNDVLAKVSEQSERLTTDSQEMENLNRTLTGICKIYEMQLKGASAQIGTIDQINEQTRKMASQIERLNEIYTRMIEAMTVNMRAAAPGTNI